MMILGLLVWCLVVSRSLGVDGNYFPPNFMFGAASSANQNEGAWNVSGRTESVWDRIIHTKPEIIIDRSNADVSSDSYHFWKRDLEIVEDMNLDSYRFSISWPRLLPNGFSNYINLEAKEYYSNLIDGLLEKGIEPIVTMYHFDLPQRLQDLGGWANPLIADWFSDYARVVFSLYSDRVKYWVTLNEPILMCDGMYSSILIENTRIGMYICSKNALIAHARVWRMYDEEYKPKYFGKVGLVNLDFWFEAASPEDQELVDLSIENWSGRFAHPIYSKSGGWSPRIEKLIAEKSFEEGYTTSKLPSFTAEEIELVKGTFDFYGLNFYTSRTVRRAKPGEKIAEWPFYGCEDLGVVYGTHPDWETTDADWLTMHPEGLRNHLNWLHQTYGPISILITENGYPSADLGLADPKRTAYLKDHLEMVLAAINDGVDVIGYTVWCLMDNFDWLNGYSATFGLYSVNFSDPLRARTPRESAKFYSAVARSRTLDSTAEHSLQAELITGDNYL